MPEAVECEGWFVRACRLALPAAVGLVLLAAAPTGAQGAVQVTAGGGHSCAIQIDKTIVCWGSNSDGQAAPPPGTFQAVDAGGLHTCGIRTDGTAECWGKNDDGEATAPPGTFLSVSAGGDHSCGLRTNYTLACWGRNTSGSPTYTTPTDSLFTAVSAGNTAGITWSCALRDTGTILCWGYNAYGRGNPPPGVFTAVEAGATAGCALAPAGSITCWGGFSANGAPFGAAPPPGIFTALSGGYDFSCALRHDQTLSCLGDDTGGRATPLAGTFQSLGTGYSHSCGVRTNGAVACWGSNASAQVSPIPPSLTQAAAGVSPGGVAFGAQQRGTVSAPKVVTVTNNGAADLHIVGESFSGPAGDDFFIGASTCRGPIPGGETCKLWVRFAPQGEGTRTATLTLDTNAAPAEYTVSLTGTVVSCKVPKLAGKTLSAVKSALAKANCALGRVTQEYSTSVNKGRAIKSSPAAGQVRAKGAKVNVVMSRGRHG